MKKTAIRYYTLILFILLPLLPRPALALEIIGDAFQHYIHGSQKPYSQRIQRNSNGNTDTWGNPETDGKTHALGRQKILLIPLNFTDNPIETWTRDKIEFLANKSEISTSKYYGVTSGGLSDVHFDVTNWITVSLPSRDRCEDYQKWSLEAESKAIQAGWDVNSYARRIFVFPIDDGKTSTTNCWFGGIATLGGGDQVSNPSRAAVTLGSDYSDASFVEILSHELGHNFGLLHANFWYCDSTGLPDGQACNSAEYYDPFDTMGLYNLFSLNAPHMDDLGYLSPSEVIDIKTGSKDFTLFPLDQRDLSLKTVRVPRFGTDAKYYFSYRVPTDPIFSPGFRIADTGASAHFSYSSGFSPTEFMSMNRGYDGTDPKFTMRDGQVFQDPSGLIQVTQLGHTPFSVNLRFEVAPCVRGQSYIGFNGVNELESVIPGQKLLRSLRMSNTDSPTCPDSRFNISANLPAGWEITSPVPEGGFKVVPGTTLTTIVSVTVSPEAPLGNVNFAFMMNDVTPLSSDGSNDGRHLPSKSPDVRLKVISACEQASTQLATYYSKVQSCTTNTECQYVDGFYSLIARGDRTRFVTTSDCTSPTPFLVSASGPNFLQYQDILRQLQRTQAAACPRVPDPSCNGPTGFSTGSKNAVLFPLSCVAGKCQLTPPYQSYPAGSLQQH